MDGTTALAHPANSPLPPTHSAAGAVLCIAEQNTAAAAGVHPDVQS